MTVRLVAGEGKPLRIELHEGDAHRHDAPMGIDRTGICLAPGLSMHGAHLGRHLAVPRERAIQTAVWLVTGQLESLPGGTHGDHAD